MLPGQPNAVLVALERTPPSLLSSPHYFTTVPQLPLSFFLKKILKWVKTEDTKTTVKLFLEIKNICIFLNPVKVLIPGTSHALEEMWIYNILT